MSPCSVGTLELGGRESGEEFAFAYAPPPTASQATHDMIAAEVEVAASEDIISFPTRGLFAEAQLGHCNSCEVRDVTRRLRRLKKEDADDFSLSTPDQIRQLMTADAYQAYVGAE